MNEKINNIIKLLCILCICFLILAFFYYINKYNEAFNDVVIEELKDEMLTNIYKTELECIDHLKVQALNLSNNPTLNSSDAKRKLYNLDNDATEFCETKCKHSNCVYKDYEEKVPDYIKTLNKEIKYNEDNSILHLSWLKPDSEHPIEKYICVIETDNNLPVRVEIPVITNNDIIEHTINNLDENTNYTIKVFSRNKFGLSKPAILYNINLSKLKDNNEDNQEDSPNLKNILNNILMNMGTSDIKIDIKKLQNKYNIKKQLILNYLLQNSSKINKLSNNKNIKII